MTESGKGPVRMGFVVIRSVYILILASEETKVPLCYSFSIVRTIQ